MGSRSAECYLASPAVVAASAVAGKIAGHQAFEAMELVTSRRDGAGSDGDAAETEILEGFPAEIRGELLYLPKDNMNTDGIYGKDVTYQDDLTPDQMATHAFRNYDPAFQEIARAGDILVGGRNFGSGSSREQAATAIAFFGIPLLVAASFSQTYKRNAFNNGFPLIECPALVDHLAALSHADGTLTVRTGLEAVVDFRASRVRVAGKEFPFTPLGDVAQRLVVAGGAEAMVREGRT
jgi:homoaconitate hydratase